MELWRNLRRKEKSMNDIGMTDTSTASDQRPRDYRQAIKDLPKKKKKSIPKYKKWIPKDEEDQLPLPNTLPPYKPFYPRYQKV